ncbi:hypothetical protein [Shimia sp.]|uniref:hypothetical protein n=1 Tax=Shimia sp. TaxID=1954381 RepID=UPI003BAB5D63
MELSEISSLADDSPKAQAAAEQYPKALGICLSKYDWSFARRFAKLPQIAEINAAQSPDPDLPYAYKMPGDCIKLRLVQRGVKWRLDDNYLFSEQATNLSIRYTRRVDDEAKLPDLFQTAVSYQLAVILAPKYVGARTKRADLKNDLYDALQMAKEDDRYSASDDSWDGIDEPNDWVAEVCR